MLVSVHGSYFRLIVWNLVIRFLPYFGRCSLLHFRTISYEDMGKPAGFSPCSTVAALLAIGFLGVVFIPGSKIRGHLPAEFLAVCQRWVGSTRNITTVEDFFTGDNPCAKTLGVFLAHGFFPNKYDPHTLIQKTSKHAFQCLGLHEYENMFMIQLASQRFGRFQLARQKRMA